MSTSMFILLILVATCTAHTILDPEWQSFTSKYGFIGFTQQLHLGRKLENESEELLRYTIFKDNAKKVAEHNARFEAGEVSYKLALNEFSDWLPAERSHFVMKSLSPSLYSNDIKKHYLSSGLELPSRINWTELGCVTRVKLQELCGSCWAFSTAESLEGVTCVKTGKLIELSEQQLVDCCGEIEKDLCEGCDGGYTPAAFDYIHRAGGIMVERDYPYLGWGTNCTFNKTKAVEFDTGYKIIPPGDEQAMAGALVSIGPISVCVYSTGAFELYDSDKR